MSSSRHDPDSSRPLLKVTTSPSKRQRLSPVNPPWKNPFDLDPPLELPKTLPRKPAAPLASSSSSRPAESSRRGAHGMDPMPSHGSSQDYTHRDRSRYSVSPEKDSYRSDRRDYGDPYYDESSHRSYTSRSHKDWDRDWDHRGNDGRYEGSHEDDYYRRTDRREPRRQERAHYADREDRDDRRPRDGRHGRSPPRELGRSLTRPQGDDSGRHGRQDSYRPDDARYSTSAHQPSSKRPRTPSGPPPAQHEEGELSEEGEVSSDVGEVRRSPARDTSPDAYARDGAQDKVAEQSEGRRLYMKDRPLARSLVPAPPPVRPITPPSPPPPPPDDTRPPSPPALYAEEAVNPYKPRHGPSHGTKLHEDPAHPPPAPNRNHLHPTTRASTPQLAAPTDPCGPVCPKKFTRPSLQEEQEAYGKAFEGTSTLAAYDIGKKLGEGTFGVVTKGTARVGGAQVALKKLLIHNPRDGVSVTTIREIKILKALKHKNVVPLVDMVVEPKASDKSNRQDIFMVFPYMDHDLCGLLGNRNFKMGHSRAKLFMKQLLEGMAYIHANGIVHRDIKTANILVNQKGEIMIADFGLARAWSDTLPRHLANEYTNMVVTRWYRAPELLLGDTHYGPAVDMWSVGCVLGEMYYRDPIMPGGPNDEDQMRLIAERLGPINNETLPKWDDLRRYPGFPGLENHSWDREKLKTPLFASAREWGMDSGGTDLLKQLLRLDPAKRLTAEDALEHTWFWTGVSVASVEKTDLGVESSHEMTTRKDHAPAPAYQQQLNDQNRQALQQHGSHRAYIPQQQQPMQGGRPGWVGGPVKSQQQHARHAPYPPPQTRNGWDAMAQGPPGGYAPMPGLPQGMPPSLPSQVPPYPFGNGPQDGMPGGPQMGMNGGGQVGNGWNGHHGGGYGMGNGQPWNGPSNGLNGSNANSNVPYPSQHSGNAGPPPRAPPTGPSSTSGRAPPAPPFKLVGARAGAPSGPAGSYGGGPPRDSRDVPSHEWGHDDKRRRIYEHGAGDKRGPGPSLDSRETKRPRNDVLPY